MKRSSVIDQAIDRLRDMKARLSAKWWEKP